jgi:hypothetical protein
MVILSILFLLIWAHPALRTGNRAFRLYLLPPPAAKGYRFNPLREGVRNSIPCPFRPAR